MDMKVQAYFCINLLGLIFCEMINIIITRLDSSRANNKPYSFFQSQTSSCPTFSLTFQNSGLLYFEFYYSALLYLHYSESSLSARVENDLWLTITVHRYIQHADNTHFQKHSLTNSNKDTERLYKIKQDKIILRHLRKESIGTDAYWLTGHTAYRGAHTLSLCSESTC